MRRAALLALALLACVAAPSRADVAPTGKVVELTDNNFDEEVAKGPTFVVVSADWCTHCKALAPTWHSLAKELQGEIAVARVNGPNHKALLKRLRVTAYPTILYLRDGAMREYDHGKRTLAALAEFGRSGYKSKPPVPWYRAPNSVAGKITGALFRLPVHAEALYTRIKKTHNLSDVTILFAGLAVPVALGVLAVALADAYVTSAAKHAGARRRQREAAAGTAANANALYHPHRD